MANLQGKQWKIVLLPRLQIDAVVSCFLLKYFGDEKFPGIENAGYLFWIDIPKDVDPRKFENEGYIFIDIGNGQFDHHASLGGAKEQCVSEMVAEYLDVSKNRSLKKMLAFARRDDLEGKGIISTDPIDRAFGLSGLLNNLNRILPDDQEMVLQTLMPLLLAHYLEQKKREEDFPAEYENKLKDGKARKMRIPSARGQINLVVIETDEIGMAGYLRADYKINADIVIQKMSSGHVNIITKQTQQFDISEIVGLVRKHELLAKGTDIAALATDLNQPGKLAGVDEWFFDNKAKTIQNGGIRPQNTTPTKLSLQTIIGAVQEGSIIKL